MGNKIYVGGKKRKPAGRRYRPSRGGFPMGGLLAAVIIALVVVGIVVLFATDIIPLPEKKPPVISEPSVSSQASAPESVSEADTPVSSAAAESQAEESQPLDPNISYQEMYPDLYTEHVDIIPRVEGDQVVYLTFNDAPSGCTRELLTLLDQLQIKATFFVTSANASDSECKELLKAMADAGHTIGIYSYSSDYGHVYSSVKAYLEDFKKCDDMIYEATGKHASLFRFPAGSGDNSYNNGLAEELIAELTRRGYVYHDWNVDSSDSSGSAGAEDLARTTVEGCKLFEKNVVLMNNAGVNESTTEAVRLAVNELKAEGYRFAPLDPTVKPFIF